LQAKLGIIIIIANTLRQWSTGHAERLPGPGSGVVLGATVLASACSSASGTATPGSSAADAIVAVGAENEYANVIAQVGGKYVQASAIMNNPNTDPHTFEASPSVAQQVGAA
jgi:zinc/manganese transport system substrate-binding protein